MKVVVAGIGSRIADALLPLLLADERIEHVIGIDGCETAVGDPYYTHVLLDARSPEVERVLAGADAVIHLGTTPPAGAGETPPAEARRHGLNVDGGENVFRCAARQEVACIVHLSSAAVYALPARRRSIDENHPRAALPGLVWAEDQVTLEERLDAVERAHSGVRIVRLRPHLIVGADGPLPVRRLLRAPFSIRPAAGQRPPRLQCVHALDVARAVQQALFKDDAAGAFNLACRNAATLRDMQQLAGGGAIPLPLPLAYRLMRLSGRFGGGADPAWTEALRHDVVLDTSRARRKLGWKPKYDSVQACLEAAD